MFLLQTKRDGFGFVDTETSAGEEMVKGGVGGESYQPQVTWMEQKAR